MSSVLERSAAHGGRAEMPFACYAQLVRMLLPPAERIGFYGAHGETLWVNDGVDEPEFRMHVELVVARARASRSVANPPAIAGGQQSDPTYVFAIRDPAGSVIGGLGIACRNLASGARYRSSDAVERLLAPLLEVLGHAWAPQPEGVTTAVVREGGTRQAVLAAAQLNPASPLPALLRKTLSIATGLVDCAFGAVVLPDRPFTLSQRVSADESDLTINAAIDGVRAQVLKWMQARNQPLVFNATTSARAQQLPYKLLVVPLRDPSSRIAALMMLFRTTHARDFAQVDLDELTQIVAKIPAEALSNLGSPPAPVVTLTPTTDAAAPTSRSAASKKAAVADSPAVAQSARTSSQPSSTSTVQVVPAVTEMRRATPRPSTAQEMNASPRSNSASTTASNSSEPVIAAVSMDDRIRTALRQGGFDLHAQKISSLRDAAKAPRFEVLLRMREAGILHAPSSFFAAAESSRLMPELDCWVIHDLMQTLRKRAVTVRTSGLEFSVNIAAQSLTTPEFSEFIVTEVCRSAIPSGLLVFEISERTALEHEDAMDVLSARLRDIGCRIALDNCRSGLGTLDPLNKWPVSRVKIDGTLIRNIANSTRSESQVRAVVQLAADRGIETVAECVETQRVHDKLLALGIDYAQGFHLARPEPLQAVFR
jgi:EAL domain-containing protein (putative c-di-GMP-specific phosphodiesterase class I)